MNGTKKQIERANSIRDRFLHEAAQDRIRLRVTKASPEMVEAFEEISTWIFSQDESMFWINNSFADYYTLCKRAAYGVAKLQKYQKEFPSYT